MLKKAFTALLCPSVKTETEIGDDNSKGLCFTLFVSQNYSSSLVVTEGGIFKDFIVYILNPSEAPSVEKKQIHCSICKRVEKSKLHECETEHVICKRCQLCDASIKSTEHGDDTSEKEFDVNADIPPIQIKKSATKTDLAGGDRESGLVMQEINDEVKQIRNEDDKSITYKDLTPKKSIEITMDYKNAHYQESKTSLSANTDVCSKITASKEEDEVESCDVVDPRPVVCPVTSCSKIVTIDSFLLHFLFDHSKVPRTTLDDTTPQEVTLKSANFSSELQCVATFIMETQKRPSLTHKNKMESEHSSRNSKKDNKLLLLMAVRLPTSPIKLPNVKCDPSAIFTRSIHTQTEKNNENISGISTECLSKSGGSEYRSCTSRSVLDEDEVLLLWLCKLDEATRVFSITLLGEDKRRGYCYIGDAVHVRDKQDPSLLYDRSECLVVKGSAINRLFDPQGQITAIVSLIG